MIDIIKYLEHNDVVINNIYIGPAIPIINIVQIPLSNKIHDFSKLTGDYNYNPREVKIEITWGNSYRNNFYNKFSNITSYLMSANEVKVQQENDKGYFIGVVTGVSEIDPKSVLGVATITLRCNAFKYSKYPYGRIPWNDFCFATDYLVKNNLDVEKDDTFIIYNQGTTANVGIEVTGDIVVEIEGKKYNLLSGNNIIQNVKNGEVEIKVLEGKATLTIDYTQIYL